MAYEQKEGQGSLFPNDKKGNSKAPDYKGTIMIGGNIYELASWIKPMKQGEFQSISAKVKAPTERKPDAPVTTTLPSNQPKSGTAFDDWDNDPLPF